MRKKIFFTLSLIIITYLYGLAVNDGYVLKGDIKGFGNGIVIISYNDPNQAVTPDTIQVLNDTFILKGNLESPVYAFLKIMNNGKLKQDFYRIDFFMENASIFLTGDVSNSRSLNIAGSPSTDMLKKINTDAAEFNKEYIAARELLRKSKTGDPKETQSLEDDFSNKKTAYLNHLLNYEGFLSSHAGAYMLWLISKHLSLQELENILPRFDSQIENNTFLKYMIKKVNSAKRISPGEAAADFIVKDFEGKIYNIECFKGNYLLMTFSASWCGPCKYEYPYMIEAHNKYSAKGLKVIIMNLDDRKELWESVIKQYNFPFPVLSDLTAFTGSLAKDYGVLSIPKVFLIDPKGIIVSNSIRQQRILDKLEEIYK